MAKWNSSSKDYDCGQLSITKNKEKCSTQVIPMWPLKSEAHTHRDRQSCSRKVLINFFNCHNVQGGGAVKKKKEGKEGEEGEEKEESTGHQLWSRSCDKQALLSEPDTVIIPHPTTSWFWAVLNCWMPPAPAPHSGVNLPPPPPQKLDPKPSWGKELFKNECHIMIASPPPFLIWQLQKNKIDHLCYTHAEDIWACPLLGLSEIKVS